jgi:hypothetical protein
VKKPWRVICAVDGIEEEFATLDEALKEADNVLSAWRDHAHDDGEWDEEVEGVEIHLVTHAARITIRDGDNEDDGVDYGITEMPVSEIEKDAVENFVCFLIDAHETDTITEEGLRQYLVDYYKLAESV